ncbi:MAG TPA: MFS transporter [Bryobacteraceae bacterium]|nr:MFS transporter [Bryobacteraceae bacterium]HXR78487.1 MFS transporter [Bryobacteraceae bacterium]
MFERTFRAFQYRDFRVMWMGACTSSIGTWMQLVAQAWLVYRLSDSAVYLGLDTFCGQIPIFLFSLFGGVYADRKSRRNILIVSQFVQMTCAFTLAALVATGVVQVWQILCLSFIVGTAQSFGGPAYSALIPSLVGEEDLQNAIALNSIQFNVARVLGPVLGGFALDQLGADWCFGLNGLSFLAVIGSLLAIHVGYAPPKTKASVMASMKEGLVAVRTRSGMTGLIALAFWITLLSYPLTTFLPVFAKDIFHGGSMTFTMMLATYGGGSVAGALVVASRNQKGMAKNSLIVMVLLGVLIAAFALSRNLFFSIAVLFGAGIALIIVFAVNSSLVQIYVTDALRGRVMSVYNVAFRGGMPIGSLICGFLIKQTSAPVIIAANGVLLCFLAAYFLFVEKKVARL